MSTPSASRSERRKAATAAAILDAAEGLFRERGFQATTIDEIAETADVSVGSVYFHFQTKAGLYLALVERALDLNEDAMGAVGSLGLTSPLERVFAATRSPMRSVGASSRAFPRLGFKREFAGLLQTESKRVPRGRAWYLHRFAMSDLSIRLAPFRG